MKKLHSAAAIGLAVLLAACSSTPIDSAPQAVGTGSNATTVNKAGAGDASGVKSQASMVRTHLDPNGALAKQRSVYFAFDEAVIGSEYLNVIERHGKYLASAPSVKVKIEGNADERGSAEYNLALGQKRAEATMKALKLLGVRDSQMEPVSWGEERPKDKGHDDSAYSQNRRADIVYPTQP